MEQLTLARVLAAVRARLAMLLALSTVAAVVAVGVRLYLPREWQASLGFSTVAATRTGGAAAAGLPTQLLGLGNQGLQAAPPLLARLANSDGVLLDVGRERVPPGTSTLCDRLLETRCDDESDERFLKRVRRATKVTYDRETGLVSLAVTHTDSALARRAALRILTRAGEAFATAARTQAEESQRGMQRRLDSSAARLARAEAMVQEAASANRQALPYSAVAVRIERLKREASLAQTLHTQVLTEYEAARGRALESMPAVVVVEPLPRVLRRQPRQATLFGALAFVGTLAAGMGCLLLRDLWRPAVSGGGSRARVEPLRPRVPASEDAAWSERA